MMISPTGITISFGGTPGSTNDSRAVVARIFGFASDAKEPVSREMVVPAGKSVEQKLPEGLYNVELTLPSGRIIQRNVKIDQDTHETYQFFDDFASSAGFSLQESVGRQPGDILVDAATASGNTSSADYQTTLYQAADEARADAARRGPRKSRFSVSKKTSRSDEPAPPARAQLSHGLGPIDLETSQAVNESDWLPAEPIDQRGDSALWRISAGDSSSYSGSTRQWARIEVPNGGVELASLPLPWFRIDINEHITADVLVDPARPEGTATTVAIRDDRLAGLLAFLDRGQASAAGPMLAALERDDMIVETIFEKMSNPLAACAAAYVGLAVYPPNEHELWDGWLGNCMARFPGIPDAAIVHARRLMLRPTGSSDNALAAQALRQACQAGPPYFSAGVPLLREMLSLLSPDHPDLVPLAEQTSILAGRVDARQAFTVLRYAPARARGA